MRSDRFRTAACAAGALAMWMVLVPAPRAQAPRTVQDGVYSDAQAARGAEIYKVQCAGCHGDTLAGGSAPPLTGDAFVAKWRAQPLANLANKIRQTMPQGDPGSLGLQGSADVVAHVLKVGRFPAGATDLAAEEGAWKAIGWPAGAAPAQAAAASGVRFPPLSTMAQLMRSVYFPNSNLIFTVQTRDPGAPPPAAATPSADATFSYADWGAGIYTGWVQVDFAALALADMSELLLTPGRTCENGRPVPIADAQWIKYTQEMYEVAQTVYKASQTRSQQAVSDATGDLSDACQNCHRAYRDRPGGRRGGRGSAAGAGGVTGPNAGRCISLGP